MPDHPTAADYFGPPAPGGLPPQLARYCPTAEGRETIWDHTAAAAASIAPVAAAIRDAVRDEVVGIHADMQQLAARVPQRIAAQITSIDRDFRPVVYQIMRAVSRMVDDAEASVQEIVGPRDIGMPRPIPPSLHPLRQPASTQQPPPAMTAPPGTVPLPPGGQMPVTMPITPPQPPGPIRLPPPPGIPPSPPSAPPPREPTTPPSGTPDMPPFPAEIPSVPAGGDILMSPVPGGACPPSTCPPSMPAEAMCLPDELGQVARLTVIPWYPQSCGMIDITSPYFHALIAPMTAAIHGIHRSEIGADVVDKIEAMKAQAIEWAAAIEDSTDGKSQVLTPR